jgi:hypothetical protein
VIGGRAYVGGGQFNTTVLSDFWSYDPAANTWQQVASCPVARVAATGFAINGKGYIACGSIGNAPYTTELYEYDPVADSWTQKASLPGIGRSGTPAFVCSGKAYCVGGWINPGSINEVWEYDPAMNSWTQKNDFPGGGRFGGEAFSINDHGHYGCGYSDGLYFNDFWEYYPIADVWLQRPYYGGPEHYGGFGFAIDGSGYIGSGQVAANDFSVSFWEYAPSDLGISGTAGQDQVASIYCSGIDEICIVHGADQMLLFSLYDGTGKLAHSQTITSSRETIRPKIAAGVYAYHILERSTGRETSGRISLGGGD